MIDDRLPGRSHPILKGVLLNTIVLAVACPSIRKGANFSRTGKSRSWVGDWSEKTVFCVFVPSFCS